MHVVIRLWIKSNYEPDDNEDSKWKLFLSKFFVKPIDPRKKKREASGPAHTLIELLAVVGTRKIECRHMRGFSRLVRYIVMT